MSAPEFKSCLDCRHYVRIGVTGHLCTLPPECMPPPATDEEAEERAEAAERQDEGASEHVGTICDVMRRMGATCGPRATLWEAKP